MNTPVSKEDCLENHFGYDDMEYLQKHLLLYISLLAAMEEYAKAYAQQSGKKFAQWLEENAKVIYEEKITLYRYHDSVDGWGNYILDDIYKVFEDKYEPLAAPVPGKEVIYRKALETILSFSAGFLEGKISYTHIGQIAKEALASTKQSNE